MIKEWSGADRVLANRWSLASVNASNIEVLDPSRDHAQSPNPDIAMRVARSEVIYNVNIEIQDPISETVREYR
jgi:hypothetical protein